MSAARVAIGLPVYNGELFLEQCLRSVLAQTYGEFDLLISDNGSSDRTEEIARAFVRDDQRVHYVRQKENQGAAVNFNYVFHQTGGEYFKWMSHDDVLQPTWLERCVEVLDGSGPEVVLAYTAVNHLNEKDNSLEPYEKEFPWGAKTPSGRLEQMIQTPAESIITRCYPVFGLMRRDAAAGTRLIQAFNRSDKVTLVEMALRGDFHRVPEFLFHRRLHKDNSLTANPSPQGLMEWFAPGTRRRATARKDLWDGYRRAVREAPLDPDERRACRGIVRSWAWKMRRRIAGDYLRVARLR